MKYSFCFLCCLFAAVFIFVPPAHAEKEKPPIPKIKILDHAAMETLQNLSDVPEENKLLASLVGTWGYELKYWSSADADPELSSGTVDNEMILGGRFLSSKTNLRIFMGGQSFPYEAWSLIGYDRDKKSFTSSLMDTMRTGMMTGAGQYDEKSKALALKGMLSHPWLDKPHDYRAELQFTDKESYTLTVFMNAGTGQEYKVVDISFDRQN